MKRLLFYVSGHGYGHATRARELIAALRRRAPGLQVHVRSEAPHWIFTERDPGIACSAAAVDVGVLQRNALDVDLPRTLAAHQRFAAGWEQAVAFEAGAIRELGASLVVGDVPALSFAAAARAGVPAVAVANFSWDWILEGYAEGDPRWRPLAALYREAYGRARTLYRLPFCGDLSAFPAIVDAPLLVARSRRAREECRRALGVAPGDPRRLVLVSFGGFGCGPVRSAQRDDLSDYLFAGFGAAPEGLGAQWIALSPHSPIPHEDLVHACDALIGKPGYGTVAEAVAHGARFLFLPRRQFREIAVLEAGLARHCCARPLPREDFEAGRWRPHLEALFALPAVRSDLRLDGAEWIAGALAAAFDLPA